MQKPTIDPEEWILSLHDVKQLYISMWRRLIKWAVIGGLFAFLYFGNKTSLYKIEASFKEEIERSSSENIIKNFVGGMAMASLTQPGASTIMKSYQVLRPAVEKLGIQIYDLRSEWFVKKMFRRFKETIFAEKGVPLTDVDPFIFENVVYEGEKTVLFNLAFSDSEHFTVIDDRKEEIANGEVGKAIKLEGFQFTVKKTPKKIKFGTVYPFSAIHWKPVCQGVSAKIKIANDKYNKSILNIFYYHRDRHFGTHLVNELMHQYQCYLKREYDQTAKEQLSYLENKQEQIFGKMEGLFAQHAEYLSQNLKAKGVVSLEQETQTLLIPHQQMQNKLLAIEVELSRLAELEKEGKAVAVADETPFSSGINYINQKIQDLRQQRDLLELSLCEVSQHSLEVRREELKEIRNQRFEVERMIQEIDQGDEISSFDVHQGIVAWAKALRTPEEREDLAEYLENYSRLLSMREKMLQERVFYGNNVPAELEGIDLASARNLFLEYNARLDAAEASMRHYEQYKKEIPNPSFELASLSSVLRDPICQKLISEGSALELQLKDERHHSEKEKERWLDEIALQKKILTAHLDQLYKVEEVNSSLVREKMSGLQKLSLDCINRQISVLHEQANDSIKDRRQALLAERKLLEKKMDEIRTTLATIIPEKWQFEKWLTIKTNMVNKVMDTVTEIVESKNLSSLMHHVESKPLDIAFLPATPKSPRLRYLMYLGAFVVPCMVFLLALIQQFWKGFPLTLEKLQVLKMPALGSISAFCDGPSVETPTGPDLELLRKIALFSEGGKVIGLIGGRGPDYSFALAENLARMSAKSIVLRCDFLSKFRQEECPGLLQVWKGEIGELPIRKGAGFDYMTSGGYSAFGTEIVQSQRFTQLVEMLKKNYDWVFVLFRSPIASAESMAALRFCDKAVVTVSREQIEELTPLLDWGYDGNRCRLTFVARS